MSFKKEVISYIEELKCTPHAAYVHFSKTKGYDYNELTQYQWWNKRQKIGMARVSNKRCTGAGRPMMLGYLEYIYMMLFLTCVFKNEGNEDFSSCTQL